MPLLAIWRLIHMSSYTTETDNMSSQHFIVQKMTEIKVYVLPEVISVELRYRSEKKAKIIELQWILQVNVMVDLL